MNKLLLNNSGRNHIKIFPMTSAGIELPESEADKIRWCEAEFGKLQSDPKARRLCLYKHRLKGYLVSVWELEGLYYLIICLKNEFKTFNDTIYISKDREDMLSIAKFVHQNIETIMEDYRNQILDARDWLVRERLKDPDLSDDPKPADGNPKPMA